MTTQRRLPTRRDTLLFALGCLGIGYQQVTERYHVPLLIVYGLMVGIPGIAQLAQVLGSLFPAGSASTPPEQSPSPAAPSSGQPT